MALMPVTWLITENGSINLLIFFTITISNKPSLRLAFGAIVKLLPNWLPLAISLQSSSFLLRKFMRYQCIESNTAKHTRKLVVDVKCINKRSFSIENNIQRFGSLFRDFCRKSQSISRAHRNDTDIDLNAF